MTKIKQVGICFVMVAALLAGMFTAYAADSIVFHGEANKSTLHRDDTFTYTMELQSEAGDIFDLAGISYYLRYNPDILEVVSVNVNLDPRIAGMKLDSMFDRPDFIEDGRVFIFSAFGEFKSTEPIAYPVKIAEVSFKVKSNAEYGTYDFGSRSVAFAVVTPDTVTSKNYTAELGSITVSAVTPPTPTPSGGSGTSSYAITFEYRAGNELVKSERKSYARNTQLTEKDLSLPQGYELADANFSHRSEERRVGKECRSRWSPYH